ncbi:hypothetical protein N7462_000279 [Penicillium macrosclerotiorum]|uniref:uncharacterized protein n=1 Tax=Penicillium macrosclerotiorum TaxID=303699 RepID=UPI002548DF3C|nr:uncharacterized protein N7462_000279 [Penicillium macrosclerotiorum]KAJ5698274.1 hypothetical protein N7462_000279 [Penicillium macrosclerotiorum]
MSSDVAELEDLLQSMLKLKPPGVSGSKIQGITTLCNANVQNESVLIQKIYTHFKKAPGTHKLGVLYVVDSVTRQWVEAARKAGQPPGSAAPDGTFAAGVNRVTELLPVLMTDIINNAPQDQKEKIKKLIDIWERGYTFPAAMLASFREKLNAPPNIQSTTPEGSPAPGLNPLASLSAMASSQLQPPQAPANGSAAAPDTSSILKALADMAKQNTAAPAAPVAAAPANPLAALNPSASLPGSSDPSLPPSAVNPYAPSGAMANPFAALGLGQNPVMPQPQSQSQTPNPMASAQNPLAAMMAQPAPAVPDGNALSQQLQLLQFLSQQGIPQDQWSTALQLLNMSNPMGGAAPQIPGFGAMPGPGAGGWNHTENRDDRGRDREYPRSPPGGSSYRRRSRSPGWDRRRTASPPAVATVQSMGSTTATLRDAVETPVMPVAPVGAKDPNLPPPGPKLIEWDYSIGAKSIKVLSRTLFVGGVTSSEAHLRSLFGKFGIVQTCIVNIDKRHAFIKMISRQDAVSARDGMESFRSGEMQLRTRWGVGFGPRDCSDYQTGISVIPIERLTEADCKWMLTAEYGGTGGREIEAGMVVEEPDIEIGAGVSSKAISRRIATDTGGKRGPVSSRGQNPDRFAGSGAGAGAGAGAGGGRGRPDRDAYGGAPNPGGPGRNDRDMSTVNNPAVAPAVPAYGFNFASMPMLPPGFMMGGAQAGAMPTTQPPPPGQGN